VCIYLITAQIFARKLYSPYTASAYHAWMIVFWIIDLGLAAHLVNLWSSNNCTDNFRNSYVCVPYEKRIDNEARSILNSRYYRTLVAAALLAAAEL
jgi:hypothetical protein